MDFGFSEEQERFRERMRAVFTSPEIQALVPKDLSGEPDTRPLYRELGRRGLLALNWPEEFGGGGRSLIDASIAVEELVRAGIPDTLHVNTIQIVGLFILMTGTQPQKARHLPGLARG